MDPPPLPTLSNITTATAATATGIPPPIIHLNYPDSVNSSPRSNAADTCNEPLPPVPGAKLRLMCSYGGHIIPRPHDKSLSYVGGDTRIVVVDRHSSLASLCSRLSQTLLNGRLFNLKYQLPHEDLDSLVSVTTDEDLENMIEEYDRLTASTSALGPSRIRMFLFFNKPEASASMGKLLDDAKSETWFVDAINGSGLMPRNLSDTATMSCLVNLDNDQDLEALAEGVEEESKEAKNVLIHDLHSTMPDLPMVENSSSLSSTSSSPSMANLPPIRVRVEGQKAGVEEQFAQMSFAQVVQKQDDGYGLLSAVPLPPLPTTIATCGSSEHLNRGVSDDERSDHGVPAAFRKPPLVPLQVVQHKTGASYSLPSPDSVASDTSTASASSLSKPVYCQDQQAVAPNDNRAPASHDIDVSSQSSQLQIQQVQDSGFTMPLQLDQQPQQQKFMHASTHFVPRPAASPLPMPSYYPVYTTPQQYPHYIMPIATQTQPYMSMQANMADNTAIVASSRSITPPVPTVVAASAAYSDSHPPIYPVKAAATSAYPEMAAVYRTTGTTTPLVQVPVNQFQQQYIGYSQMPHPSQSIAVPPTQSIAVAPAASSNYSYECANATNEQVYHTHQPQAAPLPPQYHTITPAVAVTLADASAQVPTSNTMQQIGTSHALN